MDGDQEEPEPSSSFLYEDSDDSDTNECRPSQAYARYPLQRALPNLSPRDASQSGFHRRESNEAEAGPSSSSHNNRRSGEDPLDQECSSSSGRRPTGVRPRNDEPVSSPSVSFSLFGSPSTSSSGSRYMRMPVHDSDSDDDERDDFLFRQSRKRMRVDDAEAIAVVSSSPMRTQPIQRFETDSCLVSSSTGAVDSPLTIDRASPDPFSLSGALGSGVDSTSEGNLPLLETSDDESSSILEDPVREASPKPVSNLPSSCVEAGGSSLFLSKTLRPLVQKSSSILDDLLAVPGPSGIKPEKQPQSPSNSSANKPQIDDDDNSSNDSSNTRQVMHCVPEFSGVFSNSLKGFSSMSRKILDFDHQYMMELDSFEHIDEGQKSSLDSAEDNATVHVESKQQDHLYVVDAEIETPKENPSQLKDGISLGPNNFAEWPTQGISDGSEQEKMDAEDYNVPPVILDLQPVVEKPMGINPPSHPSQNDEAPDADVNEANNFWCEECGKFLAEECLIHAVYAIVDKQVATRPWASLPTQYLLIKNLQNGSCRVMAKKNIGKRILFGPLEGEFVEGPPHDPLQSYPITSDEGIAGHISTKDDAVSNWMKLVRKAENARQMNCAVMEERNKVYFITTENIEAKQELRVGFSKPYATKYNLPYFDLTPQEKQDEEMNRKSWHCYECNETFETSRSLQSHLSIHEEEPQKRTKRKSRKKLNKEATKKAKTQENTSAVRIEKSHNDAYPHGCESCNYRFPTEQLLEAHSTCHFSWAENLRKISSIICPECSLNCEDHEKLWQHVNSHGQTSHEEKAINLHKCDLCYKSFLNEQKLAKHKRTHDKDSEKNFQCHLCLRKLCNKAALTSHLKFHAGESVQAYKCPICKESFTSVILLKTHISVHRVNGIYTCPTCLKGFNIYAKIRRHIRTYHPEKKETCTICGKTVCSMEKLKIHMLVHSDERKFSCDQCTKSFKRKDKLKDHQKRIHSENSKVAKNVPSKLAAQKDVEKFTFKCCLCLLGFKRRGMLVNHMSNKHPEVPLDSIPELNQPVLKECRQYFCPHCQKSYGTSMKRRLHIQKHHSGLETPALPSPQSNSVVVAPKKAYPVLCHLCPRQYLSNAKLLQHQRKCHFQQEQNNNKSPTAKEPPNEPPEPPLVVEGYSRQFMLNKHLDSQAIFALVTQDESDPYCITLPSNLDLMEMADVSDNSGEQRDNPANEWECIDSINEDSTVWQ